MSRCPISVTQTWWLSPVLLEPEIVMTPTHHISAESTCPRLMSEKQARRAHSYYANMSGGMCQENPFL